MFLWTLLVPAKRVFIVSVKGNVFQAGLHLLWLRWETVEIRRVAQRTEDRDAYPIDVCMISLRHSTGVGQVRSNSPCWERMSIHVSETGTLRHASGRALNLTGWPLSISEDFNARLLVDPNNRRSKRGLRHSVTELEPWNANRAQEKSTAVLQDFFEFIRFLTELVWWYPPQRSTNHIDKVIPTTSSASQQWSTAQGSLPCSDLPRKSPAI